MRGLAHHLHNALLPDAGFAGEVSLGASLDPLVRRLTDAELASLSPPVRSHVADALALVGDAETAEGRAFNAADVIDRVVQQHCHERAYRFSARHALEELEIVHEGPLQRFGQAVLAGARSPVMPALVSPLSGRSLHAISAHVLAAGDERWPVFDGVPFLRADRRTLADAALAAIDAGDIARAGALLLTDQDPFAPEPPAVGRRQPRPDRRRAGAQLPATP